MEELIHVGTSMVETSEELDELFAALAKFQTTHPVADRSGWNPHFKTAYADFNDVSKQVSIAAKEGLCVTTIPTASGPDGEIGIIAALGHKSGQYMCTKFKLLPPTNKRDPQGWGSALQYARRYATQMMLGISADDLDQDGELTSDNSVVKKTEKVDWDAKLKACKNDQDYRRLWTQATKMLDGKAREDVHAKITKARGG